MYIHMGHKFLHLLKSLPEDSLPVQMKEEMPSIYKIHDQIQLSVGMQTQHNMQKIISIYLLVHNEIQSNRIRNYEYLERVAELNNEWVHNLGENIPLRLHIIHMVLLYNSVLPHNFHGKKPITITITIIIVSALLSHLKDLPKRALPHNSEHLEIRRPKLSNHLRLPQFLIFAIWGFGHGVVFVFALGIEFRGEREGGGGSEARGGAHEGVRAVVDD